MEEEEGGDEEEKEDLKEYIYVSVRLLMYTVQHNTVSVPCIFQLPLG